MVTLIILDGFGLRKESFGNAIKAQGTPNLDKLIKKYPFTQLEASGLAVGLPEGQMGNSEVGHLTLGSGRKTWQDLMEINQDIANNKFKDNIALIKAFKHAEKNKSNLHLMGLLSDGGVHSHINQLFAILDCAKAYKIQHIYIHVFTDGRDTAVTSGRGFVERLENKIQGTHASIASISGRVYAMDREQRWERLEKAYNVIVNGKGKTASTAISCIEENYSNGITDEFIEPTLIDNNGIIKDNDSVIHFNYRSDRARELSFAIVNNNFTHFKVKKFKNLLYSPMKEYAKELAFTNVIYPPVKINDNLSALISQAGMKQFHVAETTKYAHVTFYFNGGIEEPYPGEERKLIESIDVEDFSYYPKMRALEITEATLEAIASQKYDFVLVNFSNPDMIGHTGNFNSAKEAIACVEKQAYLLALATLMAGGECIITADHGNAELMFDKNGNKVTSHTTNPVPCILVSEKFKKAKLKKNCSIANIAPTVLKLLNLPIPNSMEKPLL